MKKTQKYAVNQCLIEIEFSRYLPCGHSATIPQCRRMSVPADHRKQDEGSTKGSNTLAAAIR